MPERRISMRSEKGAEVDTVTDSGNALGGARQGLPVPPCLCTLVLRDVWTYRLKTANDGPELIVCNLVSGFI